MKTRRNIAMAIGLGLLILAQLACESAPSTGLVCQPPTIKICATDQNGNTGCWCKVTP